MADIPEPSYMDRDMEIEESPEIDEEIEAKKAQVREEARRPRAWTCYRCYITW